jgi:hypothetical protein
MPKTISGISRWQPELLSPYEGEEEDSIPRVNTAESWRWKAYELVAPCVKEGFIPRVTAATDVWAFAMTVIEVRSHTLSGANSLQMAYRSSLVMYPFHTSKVTPVSFSPLRQAGILSGTNIRT